MTDRRKPTHFPAVIARKPSPWPGQPIPATLHRIPARDERGKPITLGTVPFLGFCKWPVGEIRDSDVQVCAHPAHAGSSYCEVHLLASMPPAEARKRSPSFTPRDVARAFGGS